MEWNVAQPQSEGMDKIYQYENSWTSYYTGRIDINRAEGTY